jgi:hypothetical protein
VNTKGIVLSILCLATGILIGIGSGAARSHEEKPLHASATPSRQSVSQCPPSSAQPLTQTPDREFLLAEIRRTVREEMQAALAEHEPGTAPPREEAAPSAQLTAEAQRQVYDKANHVLRSAVGYGTWTQKDRQEFRSTVQQLPIPQQDQLIGELFTAIQNGKLKLEGEGPPL